MSMIDLTSHSINRAGVSLRAFNAVKADTVACVQGARRIQSHVMCGICCQSNLPHTSTVISVSRLTRFKLKFTCSLECSRSNRITTNKSQWLPQKIQEITEITQIRTQPRHHLEEFSTLYWKNIVCQVNQLHIQPCQTVHHPEPGHLIYSPQQCHVHDDRTNK